MAEAPIFRRKPNSTGGLYLGADRLRSIEQTAVLMSLVGDAQRLQILTVLNALGEVLVEELAQLVDLPADAAERHLVKLEASGLVSRRHRAQDKAVLFRLTEHPFIAKLRREFFPVPPAGRKPEAGSGSASSASPVRLQNLHDPQSGRIDAGRLADWLEIPLKVLAEALGKKYSTIHKTPSSMALQPVLRSIKRALEILEEVLGERGVVLAWLNNSHPDLGGRTPMEVILEGRPEVLEDMLEGALAGVPG